MADTNNERVGKTLALLAQGLGPFVDRECGLVYGLDWENAVPTNGPPSKTDIQFLLRTMTSTWREVFQRTLGRMERNYVSELIEARNRWAHQEPFSSDDAYRALDSAERLLQAFDSSPVELQSGRDDQCAISSYAAILQLDQIRSGLEGSRRSPDPVHGGRDHIGHPAPGLFCRKYAAPD